MVDNLDFGLDYIRDNLKKLIKADRFFELRPARLLHLIQSEELKINEVSLFKGILRWAKAQIENNDEDDDVDDIRLLQPYMKPLMPHIRFPLFSTFDFIQYVATKGFLEE